MDSQVKEETVLNSKWEPTGVHSQTVGNQAVGPRNSQTAGTVGAQSLLTL